MKNYSKKFRTLIKSQSSSSNTIYLLIFVNLTDNLSVKVNGISQEYLSQVKVNDSSCLHLSLCIKYIVNLEFDSLEEFKEMEIFLNHYEDDALFKMEYILNNLSNSRVQISNFPNLFFACEREKSFKEFLLERLN